MQINLEIYVESDCSNCQMAYDIADLVRHEVPDVDVSIVDISEPDIPRPDKVFAVPTYILNGQTRSLGNPDAEKLVAELKDLVKQ